MPDRPLTLLDFIPAAAAADPATSTLAFAEHVESGAYASNKEYALAMVRRHPGLTATELYAADGGDGTGGRRKSRLSRHEWSRRLPNLRDDGLVRQGPQRTCRENKRLMVTWWPVEDGGPP